MELAECGAFRDDVTFSRVPLRSTQATNWSVGTMNYTVIADEDLRGFKTLAGLYTTPTNHPLMSSLWN
jgi:hypothetical protein